MNRYPVGMRVIIIHSLQGLVGKIGTVIGYDIDVGDPTEKEWHLVMVDDDPQPDGRPWYCYYTSLRPISDESRTIITWDECVFRPSREMAS
jgi:hypothetical protein